MTDQENELYYAQGLPMPETPRPGEPPGPWKSTRIVGKAVPRVDAYERVSGAAVYPSDVVLPNMLYGAILRCPHPHARIKRLATGKAQSMPGVHAVISSRTAAADIPWTYSGGGIRVESRLFDTHCRFEGETVAAVAAETPYLPRDVVNDGVAGRVDAVQQIGGELHVLALDDDTNLFHGVKRQSGHDRETSLFQTVPRRGRDGARGLPSPPWDIVIDDLILGVKRRQADPFVVE